MDIKRKRVERDEVIRWDDIVNHGSLLNHDVYHYFSFCCIIIIIIGAGGFLTSWCMSKTRVFKCDYCDIFYNLFINFLLPLF